MQLLDLVGQTPLIRLSRLPAPTAGEVWVKLEGQNPGGSVKDRAATWMLRAAMARGEVRVGDRLVEATSGNTGIALAMVAAALGLRMCLVMPDNQTQERCAAMRAYGAELILVPAAAGMEGARDLATAMRDRGEAFMLDQFSNPDNPRAHYEGTGPEIWQQSAGRITHFVSSMGTTGTIMGVSRYLKEHKPEVEIIGLQPAPGSQIAGIRRWPAAYMPAIYDARRVDRVLDVEVVDAIAGVRALARQEGLCVGVSSGAAVHVALQVAAQHPDAVVVAIICDRGDRYLSTGIFAEVT